MTTKIFIGICFGLIGMMWMKMEYDSMNHDKSWKSFMKYLWRNC